MLEFEPHVRLHLRELFIWWDKLCDGGVKGLSGNDGEGGWKGSQGWVWFDCLPWYNYLAFDIIGEPCSKFIPDDLRFTVYQVILPSELPLECFRKQKMRHQSR